MSFHSKLNSQFTKTHPNIFIFTHVLNTKIQTDAYIHINGININTISKNSAFNKKKKKQNIKKLSNDLNDNNISKITYLKHVSKYYTKSSYIYIIFILIKLYILILNYTYFIQLLLSFYIIQTIYILIFYHLFTYSHIIRIN